MLLYEEKTDGLYAKCNPYYKETVTSVEIPQSYEGKTVVGIADFGFEYCSALESVAFPEHLKKIGKTAFFNCPLQTVELPDGVVEISEWAFSWCNQLTEIHIPNSLQTLGRRAFWYCTSLSDIKLGDNVLSIGAEAFAHCASLSSITLGASLESVGADAFINSEGLKKVEYTGEFSAWCTVDFESQYSNPVWVAKCLYLNGELVENIVIEEGVEEILKFAFAGNECLQTIVLPSSLLSVELNAFLDCNLSRVYYCGGESEFENVSFVEAGNACVKRNLFYYSETEETGNFWRYENGIPTVWA